MTKFIQNKKVLFSVIAGLALVAIMMTIGPVSAIAEPSGKQMPAITGSVNVKQTMKDYIDQHRTVSFSAAAATAEGQVTNGIVMRGQSGVVQGYLAYTFFVVDSQSETGYKVIVDAGNNQVLYKSEGTSLKDMKMSHGPMGFGPFANHGFAGKMMKPDGWAPNPDTNTPAPEQQ